MTRATDSHIWGERYDRDLNDIFALQDEISQAIVAALKVRLLPEERKAIESRSTDDPEAYQTLSPGAALLPEYGARNLEIAIRFWPARLGNRSPLCSRLGVDRRLPALSCIAGESQRSRVWRPPKRRSRLDPTLAEAHSYQRASSGRIGRYDEALAAHEELLRLEPDSFDVRFNFGRTCLKFGRHEAAIEHLERAAPLAEDGCWAH